jgi:hypothetical protein
MSRRPDSLFNYTEPYKPNKQASNPTALPPWREIYGTRRVVLHFFDFRPLLLVTRKFIRIYSFMFA